MLNRELHDAGARHTSARAPATVDAAWFAKQAGDLERILRLQYDGGKLDPRDEDELARHDPTEITGAIRRFAFLKHLYWRRSEDLVRREEAADVQEVARELLRAEPIRLELAGTTVEVTDRSYSAMYAIAAHWMAIQMLDLDLERAGALYRSLHRRHAATSRWDFRARRRLHRHLRHVGGIYRRAAAEREGHRRAIYAHAFTTDGAPARSLEEAPDWWSRITPRSDAVLVAACLDVGAGRYRKLGPPPERDRKDRSRDPGEDFGWASLFASIERQQKVAPAALYDRRLYQTLTWLRAGAPGIPGDLEG